MHLSRSFIVVTGIALTVPGVLSATNGYATWYHTGRGNCGAWSKESDFIVALSTQEYNNGAHCWQHIKVSYGGKVIEATVVDSCPGCSQYSIDLSPSAFGALAPLDQGFIPVTWWYT